MDNGNEIFKDYNDANKNLASLIKKPRFWITIFVSVLAIGLVLFLIKSTWESLTTEELKASIKIISVDTKWVDKKVSPTEVTIVPSITINIKNIGSKTLKYIKFTTVFHFEEGGEQLTDGYTPLFEKSIEPGESSGEIFIKGIHGYSASSKEAFIKNINEWKKIRVKLFARTNAGFALLGEYPIKQVIIGINKSYEQEKGLDPAAKEMSSDLKKNLKVSWTDSLWIDKKGVKKDVVIVPLIKLKLQNLGQKPLKNLFIKAEFEFIAGGEKIGEDFLTILKKELPAGAVSGEITLKSGFGYTAKSKKSFIKNRAIWKRVRARILVKVKNSEFISLGTFTIKQKIAGVKVVYQQL